MTTFQFVNTENYDKYELRTSPISICENRYFCAICDRKLNDIQLTDAEINQSFKNSNGFTCNVCYQVYRSLNMLKEHQMIHFKDTDLKVACIECTNSSKTFDIGGGTLDEVYTKNDVRSGLLCQLCGDRCFDDKNKYLRHIRDHYDRTVYTCDHCNGVKIIGWERWTIHNNTAHAEMELSNKIASDDLPYKCSVCNALMKNISDFQKHFSHCQSSNTKKTRLSDGDSVYCGVCCVEMPEIREVKQKLESEEHDESDYYRTNFDSINCLMCHKVFMSNGDLKDHQKKDHFESKYEKRFACARCINKTNKFVPMSSQTNSGDAKENTFCSMCNKFIPVRFWSKHIRNHRDRVVYQCETCRKIRIGLFRFQNHLRQSPKCGNSTDFQSEKGEMEFKNYTYQCEKCKRTFSRRSFKVHIDEGDCYKENHCKTCLKRFITQNSLNEHRLVGDCLKDKHLTNFDCKKCAKSFHTQKGFRLHSNLCRKSEKRETVRCDICKISVDSESNHWNDIHCRKPIVKLKRTSLVLPTKTLSSQYSTGIQFGCLLCDDTFSDRQRLKLHMKTHYCDKSVQTMTEDLCEMNWDIVSDSKHIVSTNMKDEKLEFSAGVEICDKDDVHTFPFSNENVIKTESAENFEDIWASNSDNFDNLADDDHSEINDEVETNPKGKTLNNSVNVPNCCLCKNFIPDLINSDDVLQQQITTFGECVCQICFLTFSKIEKLREHEASHSQENKDGHQIACRLCAWSSNVYYTDIDYFRMENELQCYMCSTKMSDMRTLRRHKRSHLSLCVFTCKVCNKKSISDERHRSHLRKHQKPEFTAVTNQVVRKCTICGDEATSLFRDEEEIDKMFEKFGGGPCKICFTYISDKKRYISHERSHMDDQQLVSCFKCCNTQPYTDDEYHKFEDELKCFICNTKLSTLYNLHLHKRKHLDRVVYSCNICLSLVVGTRNHSHHLYKHGLRKKNREEEAGQYECHYCSKIFPHKSSLPAHFKQHLNKERVPCPQCTLTFASKGNLTQHIKQIHLNIRKHICELCGKAFGHPHNLKSHMVKHSGEKPYQCPICLKRFGYYSRMKTHAWIHSGLKPYKCDQCDKCYNDSTDLRRHKRIHGGVEKKFECELCKIKFYEHKYLRAHRASAHKFLVQ